jgi:type I restriction enzyme R subunit
VSPVTAEKSFEASIEEHLLGAGWVQDPPAGYDRALGLLPDALFEFLAASQPEEWLSLCKRHGGETKARAKVVKRVADEITSRGTIDVLRRGVKDSGVSFQVAFFAPAHGLTPKLWERYRANRLSVVRQLHHSETRPQDSLDVTLFVNGIPTATAELKNPLTGQTVANAMGQYRGDRNPADLIFKHRTVVHFAVDPDQVYMTTRLAGQDTVFLPFNQGSGGPGSAGGAGNPTNPDGYRTAYLWQRVWDRDAWLGLLGSFVHVEDIYDERNTKTGVRRTLFPRFHQWDAVTKLLAATRADGPGVDRLVQHSAGSGKSNTIAWTAHELSRLHTPASDDQLTDAVRAAGLGANEPIFHKVIVITDRVVLDRQLQATIAGFEHTRGAIVTINEDSNQLRAALQGATARVIVTTLQKFPVVAETATTVAGQRFAILVDEAHSSTTGEAMKDMKAVLTGMTDEATALAAVEAAESAIEAKTVDLLDKVAASMTARGKHTDLSFFAFTATPKPKTLELFGQPETGPDGEDRYRPFHLYSMRQAIEEGFILDVLANYTTYDTYYRLANHTPDDPEVPAGKASAALARFVSLHPTNLAQKAEIIVEHFRAKTQAKIDGHAKAMVVTRSRLHAVRYKQAIDAYIAKKGYDKTTPSLSALVAFSGTVIDPADPTLTYTEAFMNGFGEGQLPAKFASDDYQVLVVAEKYQTGFDQPLLHTMYVDKKLAGVKAVQTLSRLNRTHPAKTDTFVLDFANSAEEITEAFEPFYEQTTATPTDPNVLYGMERTLRDAGILDDAEMTAAVDALLSGKSSAQKTLYANLNPAVDRFTALEADAQVEFRDTLKRYIRAYAFLAQVMPWTERDLEQLYLYGKALAPLLPAAADEPLPQISDAVALTHLRTEAHDIEAVLSLTEGSDEPGVALPGGGAGRQNDPPRERLSALIDTLNTRFGMNLTDADAVWFEQQKQAVKQDEELRTVALHNDRDQYQIVLERYAENAIIDRHHANGILFEAFFNQPDFRTLLLDYLAGSYDEIRAEGAL